VEVAHGDQHKHPIRDHWHGLDDRRRTGPGADFYDIALRDVGLVLAALTLARLATAFTPRQPAAHA
jgi:hypothetical protein